MDSALLLESARQNHGIRFAPQFDQPQAAVHRFHAGDGGVIRPEAHDIVAACSAATAALIAMKCVKTTQSRGRPISESNSAFRHAR